jgi:microsomal dipeptidase-like Zn-dependent dipeptidase
VTLAHLFYRKVATNANAIPFLPDRVYDFLFPQPPSGLTDLGRAAVQAMVREHILVDLSHASAETLDDAFALLDEIDPAGEVPVLASHVACRLGTQPSNLTDATIRRVAERGGVMGLILAAHQSADGLGPTRSLDDSLAALITHCDHIHEVTGSHRHTALGTDLDGFIKPTLAGLEDASALSAVERALVDRYGAEDAGAIASGNALRLLRGYWRGAA